MVEGPKPNLRVLFGLWDSPKYIAEVLKTLIVIVWTYLAQDEMSVDLNLDHLGSNILMYPELTPDGHFQRTSQQATPAST